MQAFENFITAAKSGGGENLNGNMAELGILQGQTGYFFPGFPIMLSQSDEPIKTRAALAFLLSDKGNFFREFILDEVKANLIHIIQIICILCYGSFAKIDVPIIFLVYVLMTEHRRTGAEPGFSSSLGTKEHIVVLPKHEIFQLENSCSILTQKGKRL